MKKPYNKLTPSQHQKENTMKLLITLITSFLLLGTASVNAQYWEINKGTSALDDSPEVFAKLNLSEGFAIFEKSVNMQCTENETLVVLKPGELIFSDLLNNQVKVQYRIDAEKAVTEQWQGNAESDGAELKEEKAVAFLQKIYNAEKLFVRMSSFEGGQHDMDIDLKQSAENGIKDAIDAIADTCNWSPE